MSLLQRLTAMLDRGESREYEYQCLACTDHFVTDETHMARVACPGCGSSDVRSVAGEH
jgi:Zn finger protein HypA/HybF involved in hydrogenase expression